uniref:Vomeronasal type-1 receptor n=2 Tax=Nannospalax galili TaxID=1026970 RepID=A0A4Y1N3J3_NANGA|nr:vomeronasal type 1 receptor 2 [Nannospalax galili]AWV49239.1 vomeronasal type 1 receptor 2 [Nannospalax galili]AWV49240.1 vomeronasal type 1 receptor 2 [Nannospalax galili]AWV49241.1 vomeronasal type 1 receptor 2 [Nannospalax galili]AWV49242.1 vomeronasal type 1 receptor 2 [Nannospalax galili]
MNKVNKHNIGIRNTIYSEAGIGISANSILLLFHILMPIRGQRPRLTDLPIGLLALIHLLMLIVMGLIATDIFLPWQRWDDITCKFIMFLYRFFRSLSLCTTSLISILQAITLSPRTSCLAKFKRKSLHLILCSLLCMSVFYTSISSVLLKHIIATPNSTSPNLTYVTESCSLLPISHSVGHAFFTLLTIRDAILTGFMALSSAYMVTFLYRHKKQSQFLHGTSLSPIASPEQRATCFILLLMSFFVLMSTFDSIVSYLRHTNDNPILYCVQIFAAHSYATVSPLLILSTEKRIINIVKSMICRTVNI